MLFCHYLILLFFVHLAFLCPHTVAASVRTTMASILSSAAPTPPTPTPTPTPTASINVVIHPTKALSFFNMIGKLKTLKRTGWVNNKIYEPESVADHMYRMSMLCFLITDPLVNKDRLMKVCLMHDVAESIVGDITPYDGVSKEHKKKMELDAMKRIVDDLDHPEIASELMALWMEYEEGTSLEAELARQLDKFEMIVQADEYERTEENDGKRLDSFFDYTEGYFKHPEIASWDLALRDRRSARLLGTGGGGGGGGCGGSSGGCGDGGDGANGNGRKDGEREF